MAERPRQPRTASKVWHARVRKEMEVLPCWEGNDDRGGVNKMVEARVGKLA